MHFARDSIQAMKHYITPRDNPTHIPLRGRRSHAPLPTATKLFSLREKENP